MNIRYIFGTLVSLPLLPLMYYQGKQIRKKVPELPEAKGIEGQAYSDKAKANTLKILSIGESTIAGIGVQTHEEAFTGSFARELSQLYDMNVKWKVYARSGYTARKVEKKIVPKIIENQADLIVIGLGGNDAFTLNRPSQWKADIRLLLQSLQLKFPKAVIVFCNMPPIKEFPAFTPLIKFTVGNLVEILGNELQKVVKDFQKVYYFNERITLEIWMSRFQLNMEKESFFSDGVHPSKLTYQTWGKDVANKVFDHNIIKKNLHK